MTMYPYQFEAPISTHDVGSERYLYTVIWVPEEVTAALPMKTYPKLRVEGEIAERYFEASLTPVRGRWYILLNKRLLADIGAGLGDEVEVRFAIADQDKVDVPDTLSRALSDNPDMDAIWANLTPGKRRGLAYMVASAKTEPTREKRVAKVFAVMRGDIDMKGNPL